MGKGGGKRGGSLQYSVGWTERQARQISQTRPKQEKKTKKKQNKNTAGRVRGNYRGIYNSSTARRVIPHESGLDTRTSPHSHLYSTYPGPATHIFISGIQTITFVSADTYAPFASSSGTTAPVSL